MSIHVLIVDTSTTLLKAIRIALKNFDAKSTQAQSLENMNSLLKDYPYECVFVNTSIKNFQKLHEMPPLSKDYFSSKFIAIKSSYCNIENTLLESLGFQYTLIKPFYPQDIVKALQHIGIILKTKSFSDLASTSAQKGLGKKPSHKKEASLPSSYTDRGFLASSREENDHTRAGTHDHFSSFSEKIPQFIQEFTPIIQSEVEKHARLLIEKYCAENFENIASSLLKKEIQRLTQDDDSKPLDAPP